MCGRQYLRSSAMTTTGIMMNRGHSGGLLFACILS